MAGNKERVRTNKELRLDEYFGGTLHFLNKRYLRVIYSINDERI